LLEAARSSRAKEQLFRQVLHHVVAEAMNSTTKAKTENDLKGKLLAYKAIGDSAHASTLALGSGAMKNPTADRAYRQQLNHIITVLRERKEVLVHKLNLTHQNTHRTKDLETLTEQVLPKQAALIVKPASSTSSVTERSVKGTEPTLNSASKLSASDAVEKQLVPEVTVPVSAERIAPTPGVRYYSSDILHLRARVAALTASLKGEHDALRLHDLADPPLQLVLLVRQLTMQVDGLRKLAIKIASQAAPRASDTEFERALHAELRSIGDAAQKFVDAMKRKQQEQYGDKNPHVMKELRFAIAIQRKRAEAQTVWLMAQLDYVIDSCVMPASVAAAAAEPAKKPKSEHNIHGTSALLDRPANLEPAGVKGTTPLDSSMTTNGMKATPLAVSSAQTGYVDSEVFTYRVKSLLQTLLNESVRENIHVGGANKDKDSGGGKEGEDDTDTSKSLRYVKIKSVNDPAVKLLASYNIFLQASKNPHLIRLRPFGLPALS
jgi:hypothetical protein